MTQGTNTKKKEKKERSKCTTDSFFPYVDLTLKKAISLPPKHDSVLRRNNSGREKKRRKKKGGEKRGAGDKCPNWGENMPLGDERERVTYRREYYLTLTSHTYMYLLNGTWRKGGGEKKKGEGETL